MGDLRNCPHCGKIFVYMVRNLCPACVELEEQQYEQVKDYLRKHPGALVDEIVEVVGIEEAKVLRWMRDGRLVVAIGGKAGLTCLRCGHRVDKGSLCPKCMQFMTEEINAAKGPTPGSKPAGNTSKSKQGNDQSGMHIRNKN